MRVLRVRWKVGVLVAVILCAASLSARAEEVYEADMTSPKGLGTKSAKLVVTIRERSSDEQRAELLKTLDEEGSDAAFDALRKLDIGTAKIVGGTDSSIVYFYVHPGQNGATAVIITAHPLYFPEDTPNQIPQDSVGLIILTLNNVGKGRGNLAEAQKVRVTDAGTFEVEGQAMRIDLENVQRVR